MRDKTHDTLDAYQEHESHESQGPAGSNDFWSEASGNQDVLNECYRFMASSGYTPAEGHNHVGAFEAINVDDEGIPQSATSKVMLVQGDAGCGATALGRCLAQKLRAAGLKVLEMDKVSEQEPVSFKANLDATLRIPPDIGSTAGASSSSLSALQLAVLRARDYECFIVHDAHIYGTGDTIQDDNAALMIQLMRVSPRGKLVIFGAANWMGWLVHSLQSYSLGYREMRLDPMPPSAKFGQFITSVALRVLPPCPPGRIESLDVDAVYAHSGGRVGSAVTALIHQITEQASPTSDHHSQQVALWTSDEEEFSLTQAETKRSHPTPAHRRGANQNDKAATRGASKTASQRGREVPALMKGGWEEEKKYREGSAMASQTSERPEADFCHRLPAVESESFSSWIARQTQALSHSIGHHLGDYLVVHCSKGGADPDLQWDNLEILESLSPTDRRYVSERFSLARREKNASTLGEANSGNLATGTGTGTSTSTSTSTSTKVCPALIPYIKSLNYCPECFKADVAAGISPALRLDWRHPRLSICMRHDAPVLLEQMATSTFSILDKAWRAFAEYAGSPAARLTTQFPIQHSSSIHAKADSDRLADLAGRVQTWVFSLTPKTSPSAAAAALLMSYWLQDPNESGAQGFARSYFFNRLNKPQKATKRQLGDTEDKLKPDSARPRDLAVAYWMLGIGFGVIDPAEAKFIHDTARPYSLPFPVTPQEVCSLGGLAYSRGQKHAYLEFAQSTLTRSEYQSVAWALEYEGRPYKGRNRSRLKKLE